MISVLQEVERPVPQIEAAADESGEFEIVMGRGQMASTMLLMLVLLVVFSGGAYVVGKTQSARAAEPTVLFPAELPPAQPVPAPVASAPVPVAESAGVTAPLYGDQVQGKVYVQVGAVDKGLAAIWAEGLRTHGLDAFVAPGPSEKIWRVVIGPLPDPAAYQHAKDVLDQLVINNFARKVQ